MNPPGAGRKGMEHLLAIMECLRDSERGCPWDLQQDFRTLAPYALEEACEVVEAAEAGDMGGLRDELGDLLFQVVFHARLAEEAGLFDFDSVVAGISDKLVRRHPHVFADASIGDVREQTLAWEAHKRREQPERGVLDGVALTLPALSRANKLQQRAARVGFDWPDSAGAVLKTREELDELCAALEQDADPAAVFEECGDLLFAAVNLVRHAGVDPEAALRSGNRKFERRFRHVETCCAVLGRDVRDVPAAQLEDYWEQAKLAESAQGDDC